MMNDRISKTAISLLLLMGHTHVINISIQRPEFFLFDDINRFQPNLHQRKSEFKTYFSTFIFSSKISHLMLHRSF